MKRVIYIAMAMLFCCTLLTNAQTNSIVNTISPPASKNINEKSVNKSINGSLYEFTYTLKAGQKLGFGKAIELLENEQYQNALREIQKKTSSGTSWDKEVTDGYQYGYFAETMKGICLEKMGDVVKAYRAYQNARNYCDEEKASKLGNPYSAPKLEVYVGIGRMCNAAERRTDSLKYLDAARIEAAEYPSIAAAADRAMIARAIQIGDYEEAAYIYNDLQQITTLQKKEYLDYARILFDMWRNRKGFSVLLEGLRCYGIDNDLGFEDPLVKLYLKVSLRAEDSEVKEMYDLLGYAIKTARAEKGDEDYLTKLLNARKYFCMAYDYLSSEQDLAKLKNRIDAVKDEVKYIPNRTVPEWKIARTEEENTVDKIKPASEEGEEQYLSFEDKMMEADILYKQGKKKEAHEQYEKLLKKIKGTAAYKREYDGTTWGNALTVQLLSEMLETKGTTLWSKVDYDGSYRSEEFKAKTYLKLDIPLEQQIEPMLPSYNSIYVEWLRKRCNILTAHKALTISELEQVVSNRNGLVDLFVTLVKKCAKAGDIETGYKYIWKRTVEDLYLKEFYTEVHYWRIIPDLSDEDFEAIFKLHRIKNIIKFVGSGKEYRVFDWNLLFEREKEIRDCGEKIESKLLSIQIIKRTHIRYAELWMDNLADRRWTNAWLTKMIAVLPGYVYDYPASRSIPLIKNTREWLKTCDKTWVQGSYKLGIRARYNYYKAHGIEMLPPEKFDQADEFLANLERKAIEESDNEK